MPSRPRPFPALAAGVAVAVAAAMAPHVAWAQDLAADEAPNAAGQEQPPDCSEAFTMSDIDVCASARLDRAEGRMQRYLAAALHRHEGEDEASVRRGIVDAQAVYRAYREIECAAVYEDWKGGTIRTLVELTCKVQLTDARTHAIWRNWLTYVNGSPADLPEPGQTE